MNRKLQNQLIARLNEQEEVIELLRHAIRTARVLLPNDSEAFKVLTEGLAIEPDKQ